MRRYPEYKDSQIEGIGEIPKRWQCLRLEHITSYVNRGKYSQYVDFSEYKIINQNCVHWEGLRLENVKYISKESWDSLPEVFKLRRNDVLVNSTGFGTIGRLGLWQGNGNYTVDGHVTLLRVLENVLPKYLYYLLVTPIYQGLIEKYCITGATKQTDILKTLFSKLKFVVPPKPEQIQIASFLDSKTQQIDELIRIKARKIELLGEQRTALINQAVTKGLDPNVEMKPSGVEWIGEIPAHWEVKDLKWLIKTGTSITYGIVQAGPDVPDGIPYIRTSDMAGEHLHPDGYKHTSPEIDKAYKRSKVYEGDIVVAIRATVGKALPVPKYLNGANLTQGTAKVSPSENVDRSYLLWAIRSNQVQQRINSLAKGATFREITLDMLRRLKVTVPPFPEQRAIADYLDRKTQQIDELISEEQQKIQLLKEYRQSLISEVVTGKIDVRSEA